MAIDFACPDCGKAFSVKDELAGVRGRCTGCGQTFRVPMPDRVEIEELGIDLTAPIRPESPPIRPPAPRDGRRKNARAVASAAISSVVAACLVAALAVRLLTPEAPAPRRPRVGPKSTPD